MALVAHEAGHLHGVEAYAQELVTLGTELDDPWTTIKGIMSLAHVARDQGHTDQAAAQYKYCLAISRRIKYRDGIANALNNLAVVTKQGGPAKLEMLNESLTLNREVENLGGIAANLSNIGDVYHEFGGSQDALRFYRDGLHIEGGRGYAPGIAHLFENIARVVAEQGQPERAARLYAAAEVIRESARTTLPEVAQAGLDCRVNALRSRMGDEDFSRAWTAGREMSLEDALFDALSTE